MFKKYDAYKDSGVEWLGQLPSCWDLLSNKYIFKLKKDLVGKKSKDYELLSLTLNGVIKRDMENPEGKFPAEFDTYQKVQVGDFIFCHFDVEETPRTIGLSTFNGMITGAYTVYQVDQSLFNSKFLYYFYLNLDVGKRLKPLYKGLRNTIGKDVFGEFKTFIPTKDEQRQIAEFLDQKTSEIEQAIAIKEQQIALLNERKQIVIQKAVTQGLNPHVAMKDSGVEWIGQIPEHWAVKKIKHVSGEFMYGTSVECNSLSSGTPVLRIPNIDELYVNFDDLKFTQLSKSETENYCLRANDILVIRTNGNPELVGKSALIRELDGEFLFASYLIRIKPKKLINPEFLICIMNSSLVRKALTHGARTSVGNYNLNTQTLGNCYLTLPPLEEQMAILNFVKAQSKNLEDLINMTKEQIEKLKEYKTTLINDAVTGKIKVA